MTKNPKPPSDPNKAAHRVISQLAGIIAPRPPDKVIDTQITEKNPAAVALGRLGGLKGGKARAEKLSAAERKKIAQKAAKTRWEK